MLAGLACSALGGYAEVSAQNVLELVLEVREVKSFLFVDASFEDAVEVGAQQ